MPFSYVRSSLLSGPMPLPTHPTPLPYPLLPLPTRPHRILGPHPHPPPQVISSPSRLVARDPPYVTDFGDPYAPTMAPQVSPGRTARRVTFATDTMFRCG